MVSKERWAVQQPIDLGLPNLKRALVEMNVETLSHCRIAAGGSP